MGKDDLWVLRWLVSYVLPVVSLLMAIAALLLAMYLDQENQILRQSVKTLQDIEIKRQTERVNKLVMDTQQDLGKVGKMEKDFDHAERVQIKANIPKYRRTP